MVTVTAVHPAARFGELLIEKEKLNHLKKNLKHKKDGLMEAFVLERGIP